MRKIYTLLRTVFAAALLLSFAGQAQAAYPTESELIGKKYNFSSTLTRVGNSNQADFEALSADFEFSIIDIYGWGSPGFSGFIFPSTNLGIWYNQSTGVMELSSKNGMLGDRNCYISVSFDSGNTMGQAFNCQMNENGTISIPNFTVRDFQTDAIFAEYTNITVTPEGGIGGGEGGGGDVASFPAAGEFDGWYKYTCDNFTLNNNNYPFTNEIVFQVTSSNGTVTVKDFLGLTATCDYEQSTGTLTLNSVYFSQDGTSIGIAPEGNWTGWAGAFANKMKWQISEDGDITIPTFNLVTYTGSTVNEIIAQYGTGTVVPTTAPETPADPTLDFTDFIGSYTFKCTQTEYNVPGFPGFLTENDVTNDFILRFTINEYGQISNFNGYEMDENKVGPYLNNRGLVDGNVYTIEMQTFNGIVYEYGDEEGVGAYSELFGGAPGTTWEQDDVAFTLTKNDDGTYTLSDLSIFLKFSIDNGDGTSQNFNEMYMSYTDLTFVEEVEGFCFNISNVEANLNLEEGEVIVTFQIQSYNTPDEDVTYKVFFTPTNEVEGDNEEDIRRVAPGTLVADATIVKGENMDQGTAILIGLPKGTYNFTVDVEAYNAEGEVIGTTSNDVLPTVSFVLTEDLITGVEGIDAENGNARYFNLQGVEIANPEKGAILIKVEGGKASKVIVR